MDRDPFRPLLARGGVTGSHDTHFDMPSQLLDQISDERTRGLAPIAADGEGTGNEY
jgi:hypothetical protein